MKHFRFDATEINACDVQANLDGFSHSCDEHSITHELDTPLESEADLLPEVGTFRRLSVDGKIE